MSKVASIATLTSDPIISALISDPLFFPKAAGGLLIVFLLFLLFLLWDRRAKDDGSWPPGEY
ncbi:hypothetical protein D9M70_411830 [compost metagenome]